jgi:hypothetical protein
LSTDGWAVDEREDINHIAIIAADKDKSRDAKGDGTREPPLLFRYLPVNCPYFVYLQLRRLGYEVSTGLIGDGEVDFVATKGTDRAYFQVSRSVLDPTVLKRELSPFFAIRDNYQKCLLTLDELDYSTEGIRHLNLMDFLLEEA